jgi:farnesyl diphosphate synthase
MARTILGAMSFAERINAYTERVEEALDCRLPHADQPPQRLHEAMRYAVLSPGRRIRPLLTYAAGEAMGVPVELLDAPAVAIELMHAFSLIHDDLPAMDDDDVRRGRPATHRAFDEATAILAADALQPLAFEILANDPTHNSVPATRIRLVALLAEACGTNGIAGGQSLDLAEQEQVPDAAKLEHTYRLKTGRLLRAAVLSAAHCRKSCPTGELHALERFADALGIAYQIHDDILDLAGPVAMQPQTSGRRARVTYPAVFGVAHSRQRARVLLQRAIAALAPFPGSAQGLSWLAEHAVSRTE